jgi:hypothetical protein
VCLFVEGVGVLSIKNCHNKYNAKNSNGLACMMMKLYKYEYLKIDCTRYSLWNMNVNKDSTKKNETTIQPIRRVLK